MFSRMIRGFTDAKAAPFLRLKNDGAQEMGRGRLAVQARFGLVADVFPERLPLLLFAPHIGALINGTRYWRRS